MLTPDIVKPNYTGHIKDPRTLRDYLNVWKLMDELPKVIVEFGIDKGGSLLLWNDIFAPDKIIGFDINKESPDILKNFPIECRILDQRNEDSIKKQADIFRSQNIMADLIIDDCCHDGLAIRNTLKYFWEFLNKKGLFIIEDWQANETTLNFEADVVNIANELNAELVKTYEHLIILKK